MIHLQKIHISKINLLIFIGIIVFVGHILLAYKILWSSIPPFHQTLEPSTLIYHSTHTDTLTDQGLLKDLQPLLLPSRWSQLFTPAALYNLEPRLSSETFPTPTFLSKANFRIDYFLKAPIDSSLSLISIDDSSYLSAFGLKPSAALAISPKAYTTVDIVDIYSGQMITYYHDYSEISTMPELSLASIEYLVLKDRWSTVGPWLKTKGPSHDFKDFNLSRSIETLQPAGIHGNQYLIIKIQP